MLQNIWQSLELGLLLGTMQAMSNERATWHVQLEEPM